MDWVSQNFVSQLLMIHEIDLNEMNIRYMILDIDLPLALMISNVRQCELNLDENCCTSLNL